MTDMQTAIYAAELGVPWWLWTLVYARRQAAPFAAEVWRWLRTREDA